MGPTQALEVHLERSGWTSLFSAFLKIPSVLRSYLAGAGAGGGADNDLKTT